MQKVSFRSQYIFLVGLDSTTQGNCKLHAPWWNCKSIATGIDEREASSRDDAKDGYHHHIKPKDREARWQVHSSIWQWCEICPPIFEFAKIHNRYVREVSWYLTSGSTIVESNHRKPFTLGDHHNMQHMPYVWRHVRKIAAVHYYSSFLPTKHNNYCTSVKLMWTKHSEDKSKRV